MWAPNLPVSTLRPEARQAVMKYSTMGSAISGGAARVKLGLRPLRVSADRVNWLIIKRPPPTSNTDLSNRLLFIGEDSQVEGLFLQIVGVLLGIILLDAEEKGKPGGDASYGVAVDRNRGA